MKTKLILGGLFTLSLCVNAQNSFPIPSGDTHVNSSTFLTLGAGAGWHKLNVFSNSGADQMGIGGTSPALNIYGGSVLPAGAPNMSAFSTPYAKVAVATGWNHFVNGASAGDFVLQNITKTQSIIFSSYFDNGNATEHMRLTSAGNLGINSPAPTYKLQVEANDNDMVNNPMMVSGYLDPTHWGSYFKYNGNTKLGVHAAVNGHNLNNAPANSSNLIYGIGVYGLSERSSKTANSECVGVQGKGTGAYYNYGGVFYGDIGVTSLRPNEHSSENTSTSFGVWATANGNDATAGYFNGKTYSNEYYQNADSKMRTNIRTLSNALDKIKQLEANSFDYNTSEFESMNLPEGEQIGLNVEKVEKLFPTLVKQIKDVSSSNKEGKILAFKTVNYINLIPVLVSGIQEQQSQIADQQQLIELQQKQLDEQKQQIAQLLEKASNNVAINSPISIETGYQMSQNEPNPFAHETVVKYTLPTSVSNAFMAVYDLTGKQITTFAIEQKGSSSITLTSEKLSAGIYIYSIVADGKVVDSKRMIIANK